MRKFKKMIFIIAPFADMIVQKDGVAIFNNLK
jgi:hypothetical protein